MGAVCLLSADSTSGGGCSHLTDSTSGAGRGGGCCPLSTSGVGVGGGGGCCLSAFGRFNQQGGGRGGGAVRFQPIQPVGVHMYVNIYYKGRGGGGGAPFSPEGGGVMPIPGDTHGYRVPEMRLVLVVKMRLLQVAETHEAGTGG